jgi:hypothetical protein
MLFWVIVAGLLDSGSSIPSLNLTVSRASSELDMGEVFPYRQLDESKNEIRLLHIKPGVPGADIHCDLIHTSLGSCPVYKALSYTWGSSEPEHDDSVLKDESVLGSKENDFNPNQSTLPSVPCVYIDGSLMSVTPNLGAALRRLRSVSDPVILWVDAICINQANIQERNAQVRKMMNIYASAVEVCVWLGESYHNSSIAFEFASKVAKFSGQDLSKEILVPGNLKALKALVSLFKRSYWSRVWIVQEIARAKSITVYCGSASLPFSDLRSLRKKMFDNDLALSVALNSYADAETLQLGGPSNLWSYDMVAKQAGVRFVSGPKDLARHPGGANDPSHITLLPWPPLLDLLVMHRSRQSTDPRDKVYALIGFSGSQWDSKLAIDYGLTTEQVYAELAQYVIESTESLEIICYSGLSAVSSPTARLPSWAPDWCNTNWADRIIHSREPVFQAAASSKAQAVVHGHASVLRARGFLIGTIKYCGTAYDYRKSIDDSKKALEIFHDWWKLHKNIKGNERAQQLLFVRTLFWTSQTADRYWRVLRRSSIDEEQIAAVILGAFENLSERLFSSSLDSDLEDYAKAFRSIKQGDFDRKLVRITAEMMIGKRFFIGSSSEAFQAPIGLASAQLKEGDSICILFGCPLPVILQKLDSTGKFMLVGPAYLDGFMDGEAFKILEAHPASQIGSWDII